MWNAWSIIDIYYSYQLFYSYVSLYYLTTSKEPQKFLNTVSVRIWDNQT